MKSIQELLRARYPVGTHSLLFEVRDGAGFSANRSCDAVALGLWPSRGLRLVGFEIKASRADWLREYRDPAKASAFVEWCDEWYLVADVKGIVHGDELPPAWGLLERNGDRLVCSKAAPLNKTPKPIDRSFLAAMLKRAQTQGERPLKAEYDKGYMAGKAEMATRHENERNRDRDDLRDLRKMVSDFERASGVRMNSWDGERIGEAVAIVRNGGHREHLWKIEHMLPQAQALVRALEAMLATATVAVPPPSNGVSASSSASTVAG